MNDVRTSREDLDIMVVDDEIEKLMGPPPKDAAPRMSAETDKPVVINNEQYEEAEDDDHSLASTSQLSKIKKTKSPKMPKSLEIIILLIAIATLVFIIFRAAQ